MDPLCDENGDGDSFGSSGKSNMFLGISVAVDNNDELLAFRFRGKIRGWVVFRIEVRRGGIAGGASVSILVADVKFFG